MYKDLTDETKTKRKIDNTIREKVKRKQLNNENVVSDFDTTIETH